MEDILVDFHGQWLWSDPIPHRGGAGHSVVALAFLLSFRLLGGSLFGDDIWMGNHLRIRLTFLASIA